MEFRPFLANQTVLNIDGSLIREFQVAQKVWCKSKLSRAGDLVKCEAGEPYLLDFECSSEMLQSFLKIGNLEQLGLWLTFWGPPANGDHLGYMIRCVETLRSFEKLLEAARHADMKFLRQECELSSFEKPQGSLIKVQWKFRSTIGSHDLEPSFLVNVLLEDDICFLNPSPCPTFEILASKYQSNQKLDEDHLFLIGAKFLVSSLFNWFLKDVGIVVTPSTEKSGGTQFVIQYDVQCPFHLMVLQLLVSSGAMPPKVCPDCGKLFTPKKTSTRACSYAACKKRKTRSKPKS